MAEHVNWVSIHLILSVDTNTCKQYLDGFKQNTQSDPLVVIIHSQAVALCMIYGE